MMAILLFHECPLIVMVTAACPRRVPPQPREEPPDPTWAREARHTIGTSSSAPASLRQFAAQVRCAARLRARGVPRKSLQTGEGPVSLPSMSRCDPVPPRDAGVPGEGTAAAGRQLDATRRIGSQGRSPPRGRGQRCSPATPRRAGPVLRSCSRCSRCSHPGQRTNRRTRPTAASPRA
jgi:hypothetical protein